ncbi:MAG: PhoH family protein [Candidatus Hydrogenedentes bacterium]|nr:PhoH family protein [Candidatus Hydrogenedentota bacterium]
MKKSYILDTNALLEDPNCIRILRNGEENAVGIPFHVILELNKLKKEPRVQHLVAKAIDSIRENLEVIQIVKDDGTEPLIPNVDLQILKEVKNGGMADPILVTNDRILQLLAEFNGVRSQEFKSSHPFESDSQLYTGVIRDGEECYPNSFEWHEGKPLFHGPDGPKLIDYEHEVWKVRPRTVYQNLAFELLLNEHIDLVTLQSEAGFGKTYIALAAALYLTLERKRFDKIYVLKPMIEIGAKMGYLPGDVEEKLEPYIRYLHGLTSKLHAIRPANKIFADPKVEHSKYDPNKFEILPLAFIRGMNIENACVIIDETQNLSRTEIRAVLTRMGENVKCICLGDTRQVDNPYLNESNNALNWIVRMLRGSHNYGHLVLKGHKSRGPICDAVLKSGL